MSGTQMFLTDRDKVTGRGHLSLASSLPCTGLRTGHRDHPGGRAWWTVLSELQEERPAS